MKVHHQLEPPSTERRISLAIGFFDGFHRGHREITRALARARRPGERAAVLTFRNHPATFLRPHQVPPLISTREERINALAAAGIDELYLVPFTSAIATLTPAEFCEELAGRMRVGALVVGENFRFGRDRAGDVAFARAFLEPRGVRVVAVPPLVDGGARISSTRVRDAIARGAIDEADRLLVDPFTIRGIVQLGAGRGHDLGFPTANLLVSQEKALPPDGVYAMNGRYDGRSYPGLVSIGTNPTFEANGDANPRTIEAWMLDFRATIYGEELALRDLRFVRPQRRFENAEELRVAMAEDATHARFPAFTS